MPFLSFRMEFVKSGHHVHEQDDCAQHLDNHDRGSLGTDEIIEPNDEIRWGSECGPQEKAIESKEQDKAQLDQPQIQLFSRCRG